MTPAVLAGFYRDYIACLNRRDWAVLGDFVHPQARHNGRDFGLDGYHAMLEADVRAIPDLQFAIERLVCAGDDIAARLWFDCTPVGLLFDLPVNGRRVAFAENVFYRLREGRIAEVWSIIDRAAIAAQL